MLGAAALPDSVSVEASPHAPCSRHLMSSVRWYDDPVMREEMLAYTVCMCFYFSAIATQPSALGSHQMVHPSCASRSRACARYSIDTECHVPPLCVAHCARDGAVTSCSAALDLATMTSPYCGSTASGVNSLSTCGSSKEVVFYMVMPPRAQITIAQLSNDFDSMHESRYGMSCPGNTSIACTDDPDTGNLTWTNTLSTTTTFFYIIDGRSSSSQGNFTIGWSTTGVVCMPLTDTGPRCVADLLVTQ